MNRVFANTAPENRNVSGETGLSYQFPSTMRNLPFQNIGTDTWSPRQSDT